MDKVQASFDLASLFSSKSYEKIINYANEKQGELIHDWQAKNREKLEHIILISKNILDFWVDSIMKNRLWYALIRCGAWMGALEAIERSVFEESMDMWLQKRMVKKISSIKHLSEILHLLEVKGVMTHGELAEKLDLNHPSTLTEIMKKIADLELVTIQKSGKYKLYCLTDAGIRYARQIRSGVDEEALLQVVIQKYDLGMDKATLASLLQSFGNEERSVVIKPGQNIGIVTEPNRKVQSMKIENILKELSYDSKEGYNVLYLKDKVADQKEEGDDKRQSIYSVYRGKIYTQFIEPNNLQIMTKNKRESVNYEMMEA